MVSFASGSLFVYWPFSLRACSECEELLDFSFDSFDSWVADLESFDSCVPDLDEDSFFVDFFVVLLDSVVFSLSLVASWVWAVACVGLMTSASATVIARVIMTARRRNACIGATS